MRKILLFALILCVMPVCSCSFLQQLFGGSCIKNATDNLVFRSSVEVTSIDLQHAREKALIEARRGMMQQIDGYIVDKYSYKDYLRNDNYEKNIELMRDSVLNACEVSCSYASNKKDFVKYSMTLQINKSDVNRILEEYK
ncbi:MAG: hypothetical protein HUK15_07300 [Bacteroidales bacterium]|nr:hypothetical protein [Bacteroidales bacterium]